jgi:hydroxymethylpyrimidine/phosphomethylpyrimidine kinase
MKKKPQELYPTALTIAGSDSGGGAGIQADLRTFNAFGVFGCSAITAVTAQNPTAVTRIDGLPPESVAAQIAAVFDKIAVKAVKTGMLFSAGIVEAVAAELKKHQVPLVVDPVMVAGSGARLIEEAAVRVMREQLLPLADWITPNIPEAEILVGRKLSGVADYRAAAVECAKRWNCRCLLKTGHDLYSESTVTDILALADGAVFDISAPRIDHRHADHGTGCTLSAALTAAIAIDQPWKSAACAAKAFVFGSLLESVGIGEKIEAMYPPEEDYNSYVKLERVP